MALQQTRLGFGLVIGIVEGAVLMLAANSAFGQQSGTNYDESKVPQFELPDPLVGADGEKITTAEQWTNQRRGEVLQLFADEMFGNSPGRPEQMKFVVTEDATVALEGKALRKQVAVMFDGTPEGPGMEILVYLPRQTSGPVPIILGYNFYGNHSINHDPRIHLSTSWMRNAADRGVVEHRATESSRGTSAGRWAVETIVDRGYGLATIYYGDVDPDYHDGFQNGVHPHFDTHGDGRRSPDQWGSIAAWAWGLSRAVDYFETDELIDATKIVVMGHSRLGKTSLWAGAQDQRFAVVISNNSGCGGAALSRRRFGETVARINTSFPHWFCDNFKKYNDRESELPIDQHMLIALIAPRPVYVASAEEDRWADPRGEFQSARHADPVYRLLDTDGISQSEMPPVNEPIHATIGYHIRSGRHDVTDYDWQQYLDFADRHLK